MYFDEDAYWEEKRSEYDGENKKPVAKCASCDCDMYAGENCYWIDFECYCEDCVQPDTLEEYEPDFEED